MPNFEDRILVKTAEILAWNKPPGLCTTGRDLDDRRCAQYEVIEYEGAMVWALHQLDRYTSGVVLFARQKNAVSRWQALWHDGALQKYYVALVHGRLPEKHMRIDAALRRENRPGHTHVVVDPRGRAAATEIWEIDSAHNYSLVLARPLTGRTHQIRVHLQHLGCPLIGEAQYNSIPCGYHDRHALHALAITTDQPAPLHHIEAPLADDLLPVATRLDIDIDPLTQWSAQIRKESPL